MAHKPEFLSVINTDTAELRRPLPDIHLRPAPPTQIGAHHGPALSIINLRGDERDSFQHDVIRGLLAEKKVLMPKYLYDLRGSELFEKITLLPEYYLTRSEQEILHKYATTMLASASDSFWLVELGAGSGKKTRSLLSAMQAKQSSRPAVSVSRSAEIRYFPIDISEEFLHESALALQSDFPTIPVQPVCADFLQGVEHIANLRNESAAADVPPAQLIIYFPGSTIGNLTREEAAEFFLRLREILDKNDVLLLAADSHADNTKPIQAIHNAYNDASGVTEEFIRNILHRINTELGANIPVSDYRYVAYYNTLEARVEMYLESNSYHTVSLENYRINVAQGERICIEYSHKFNPVIIQNIAFLANFTLGRSWFDGKGYFGVYWLCAG